jgi:hypothetical protein
MSLAAGRRLATGAPCPAHCAPYPDSWTVFAAALKALRARRRWTPPRPWQVSTLLPLGFSDRQIDSPANIESARLRSHNDLGAAVGFAWSLAPS